MRKFICASILFLAIGIQAFAQSSTVANFVDKADGYKVFLYQSLIRALNQDANPDFNMLIRDLDHIRLLTTEKGKGDAKAVFQRLDQGVKAEGFESIMTFDNAENRCHVYELSGSGDKSTWVATLFMGDAAGVIEMKGMVDVKYLRALSSINMDKLQEYFPIDEIQGQETH